jgi:glucosamine-6-phosphate deaminase
MDEYLTPSLEYIDLGSPLSFRAGMDRVFYNLIDPEFNIPEAQRIFPKPGNEGNILEIIQKAGKLDMCMGGIGITGHMAFNEPPEPGVEMTNEEFKKLPTRILKLARETRTINAYMNASADLDAIPENCITVGMKEIWMARKIRICMPRDWNAAGFRKVLYGPATCKFPCSLFQEHPDTKVYVCVAAMQPVITVTRVYNK